MDLPQNPMGTTRSSWLQPEQRGVFIRWLLPRVNSLPKWSTSPACPPSAVKSSPLTTETPLFFPPGLCAWCWCPMIRWKRMGAPQTSPQGLDKPLPVGQDTTSSRQQSCPFSECFVVRPAPTQPWRARRVPGAQPPSPEKSPGCSLTPRRNVSR